MPTRRHEYSEVIPSGRRTGSRRACELGVTCGYPHRTVCRNIKTLFNFEPPATDDEIRAAALQYVRKVSGTRKPSKANLDCFDEAVDEIAAVTAELIRKLVTEAPPKSREEEAAKARERWAKRANRA